MRCRRSRRSGTPTIVQTPSLSWVSLPSLLTYDCNNAMHPVSGEGLPALWCLIGEFGITIVSVLVMGIWDKHASHAFTLAAITSEHYFFCNPSLGMSFVISVFIPIWYQTFRINIWQNVLNDIKVIFGWELQDSVTQAYVLEFLADIPNH